MVIRLAATADIPAINKLVNGAYRGESSKIGWATEADLLGGTRTTEASLARMINKEKAVILLAEKDACTQGCVHLEQQDDILYLGMLAVDPTMQAQGIGALLMNAAEHRAKELQCKFIRMTVITLRKELVAYYMRKGFIDTGKREPFPTNPEFGLPKQTLELMIMEKKLKNKSVKLKFSVRL